MISTNRLPKAERLHSLKAIRRLFTDGESAFAYPFRYMFISESGEQPCVEVLFSVPKRYHKRANKRNLLKRRMREAYRQHKSELVAMAIERGLRIELALIYTSKDIVSYKSVENAVCKVLERVAKCD
ncbi:MAG: ribonuclease P protein component [Alistipes sp.]|nr:ribonuclease P protein component [Alistipes sp.]